MNLLKQLRHAILSLLLILVVPLTALELGVICVPVADLLGEPLAPFSSLHNTATAYNSMPFCCKKNPEHFCLRLHQLLYNDIVEIIKETEDEICIRTSHAFYLCPPSKNQQSSFWTLKKNVCRFKNLTDSSINIKHIPQQISFDNTINHHSNFPTVTLMMPYYDPTTKIFFSAGTQFAHNSKKIDPLNTRTTVFVIDFFNKKSLEITLPTHICISSYNNDSPAEKINRYVNLIRQWAHLNNGFIPYTWGGTSFVKIMDEPFNTIATDVYSYPNDTSITKTGLDCSGLVLRAAQICNIPYFYKNTTTINLLLEPIEANDCPANGDLILFKGHVMIISDVSKNLLIEARGYGAGYGKVHEISLSTIFKDIKTYQDLCNALRQKKPLMLKNSKGTITATFEGWKILKMMSVFK